MAAVVRRASGGSGARRLCWLVAEGRMYLWAASAVCLAVSTATVLIYRRVSAKIRFYVNLETQSKAACSRLNRVERVLLLFLVSQVPGTDGVGTVARAGEATAALSVATGTVPLAAALAADSGS